MGELSSKQKRVGKKRASGLDQRREQKRQAQSNTSKTGSKASV